MKTEDVAQLARLARIQLTEAELAQLGEELASIVTYVSAVGAIVGDSETTAPQVGAVHNVFRADVVTNQPDQYTEDVLAEMPETSGRYLLVKKILSTDE